ncbi:hypothetical protein IFM58399_09236 [Aspergillus lentulus]|uniref:uncharacterized protein n=1 Tax=Aspergillus lentulus TaxID=293939 RepID=UPI001394666F|nr:uncharacterized protein IFM58399_09236 [Aspergillus lentulus]GFF52089.1 hypothetical protein IFM58399_09236 [Aspergillus lentulus]GFF69482.1 hypothetical protein IFM47457_02396 [Aspergillus lentulus]GFF75555.1 hypothetical protein IFM62136_09099 [Aspergillus lentulus]GFG03798.1 hypothetical protein IFM61392_02993 [Aspergillus lentulus]
MCRTTCSIIKTISEESSDAENPGSSVAQSTQGCSQTLKRGNLRFISQATKFRTDHLGQFDPECFTTS